MKGNWLTALVLLLVATLIGWGGWWFYSNFERETKISRSGLSPEARRNPLLAADYFLTRSGIESLSVSGRDHLLRLPAEPGLLLVSHLGPSLPPEREAALIQWIEAGGHLVITPEQEWDEDEESSGNHLLDYLGVELILLEVDDIGSGVKPRSGDEPGVTEIRFPGVESPLKIDFTAGRVLLDSKEQAAWGGWDEGGYHLLQYTLGQGRVTVLSDNRFLTNTHIGEEDHAYLLWLLARDHDRAWLLYSSNIASLLSLLWNRAPQLVVATLLLLLLLVWHLGLTSGPRLVTIDRSRRNLLEHLQAAAAFSWRIDRGHQLFETSRRAIDQEWQRRHPVLSQLDKQGRCEWIAEQTGLSARAVESALYADYAGEQEFIRISSVLQKLAVRR